MEFSVRFHTVKQKDEDSVKQTWWTQSKGPVLHYI